MMSLRRALSLGLLVALAACSDPPTAATKAEPKDLESTPPAAGQPASSDPVFGGTPVATTTLAGGLIVEDFVVGTGALASTGAEVSVNYTGMLDDGTVFDTSAKRKRPYTFTLGEGRVIKGWDQGLPGMKVGGKRRLIVPAPLAYGTRPKGKIPANSRLTFEVELVEVVPPLPPPKGDEVFAGEPISKLELERGLIVEEYALGTGRTAEQGTKAFVHYTGKLDDGTVFDSSVARKKPISFVLGKRGVIEGWELGIAGMKVGGLRRLIIPAELGYKDRQKGKIPPNSRLTFTIELMDVRDVPGGAALPGQPSTVSPTNPSANPPAVNPTPTPAAPTPAAPK